ncbi:MAG: hypothetical protein P8X90_12390 [Desulfobacterales bacterium]
MSYMKSFFGRRQWVLFYLVSLGWLFFACQKSYVNVSESPGGPLNIKKILVLPFKDLSDLAGEHPDARSPASGRIFITGEVADYADDFLTDLLVSWLQSNTPNELRISNYSRSAAPLLDASSGYVALNRKNLISFGHAEAVDAVLLGFVFRFRERVGKGFSAQSPASVAFDIDMIRVADGRTVWSGSFDETQQSLGENLFQLGNFIARGGRWVTAKDMATSGLNNILKKFPK